MATETSRVTESPGESSFARALRNEMGTSVFVAVVVRFAGALGAPFTRIVAGSNCETGSARVKQSPPVAAHPPAGRSGGVPAGKAGTGPRFSMTAWNVTTWPGCAVPLQDIVARTSGE